MTHDIDRKRIEDTGERARRVIADLEYLAVAGTTQHEKQVDLLKAELEQMSTRLATRADADRIEDEIHAIETACEAAGMAATVERRDIPAWLAANLKPRVKTKKPPAEDEPVDDGTGWVVMRNDANGRRFYNAPVWGTLDAAAKHITYVAAYDAKPRGAKVVGIVEAMRLIENDARVLASAELPMASVGGES